MSSIAANARSLAIGALYRIPGFRSTYRHVRDAVKSNALRLKHYVYDFNVDRKYIGWHRSGTDYWKLSSELVFWHHKLEKGMCLPPENLRFFGLDAARETFRLLREWRSVGLDLNAPVYLSSIEVLAAWRRYMETSPPPEPLYSELRAELDDLGASESAIRGQYRTPVPARKAPDHAFGVIRQVAESRRSVRNFDGRPVDFALVEQAVAVAQLSPSACNRQPWRLHFYDDRATIDRLLEHQNGNRGFGGTVPLLAIVTCKYGAFFDASERFEPVLDGGLFLMSFLFALQSQGLSSCCLNWSVSPQVDIAGHDAANIPHDEKILTYLAIGQAREGTITPLSARRPLQDVIQRHRSHE